MEGYSTASGRGDCSGVVENENDWGLGDEVLEDPAVESHAASARGSAGASLHKSCSAACVPSIVRTGGAGSISSCSVVATGNYFDETARRSCHVISARKVICPKNKRGVQGSCDYSWHHEAATAALPKLFGVAKHYRTKNADGELSYKYKDIQSDYFVNLDKLRLFRKAWKRLTCLTLFSFLSGQIQWLLAFSIIGVTGKCSGRLDEALVEDISRAHLCLAERHL
jgi:hypothetical protein